MGMTKEEELASLRTKLDKSRMLGGGQAERMRAIEARIAVLERDADDNR